jgi:hypothetical protein
MTDELGSVRVAEIHRPVHTRYTSIDEALAYALKWGGVAATDVKRIWQSGLDVDAAGAVTKASVKAGIGATAINLDQVAGHGGNAMPWLALACAVEAVAIEDSSHLVASGSAKGMQLAILRGAEAGAAKTTS